MSASKSIPEECDHDEYALHGQISYQGNTGYIQGECHGCGAEVTGVYELSHLLVWEGDSEPAEVDA